MSDTFQSEQPGATTPQTAADVKRLAEKATAAVADEVRGAVQHGAAQAREAAAARTDDAKKALAREVAAAAEALGAASSNLEERSVQRTLFDEVSRGLASMSQALEGRSVGELVAEVAEFGRRNPAAFLGGAALAGFAVARLATASAAHDHDEGGTSAEVGGYRSRVEGKPGSAAEPEAGRHLESTAPFGQGG
jgi:hypothetical protein